MVIKYVVFEMGGDDYGVYMPILFPEHIVHSQIKVEGARADSAGFYNTASETAYGNSKSLSLGSVNERDTELCKRALMGMGASFFLKYNYDQKSS